MRPSLVRSPCLALVRSPCSGRQDRLSSLIKKSITLEGLSNASSSLFKLFDVLSHKSQQRGTVRKTTQADVATETQNATNHIRAMFMVKLCLTFPISLPSNKLW